MAKRLLGDEYKKKVLEVMVKVDAVCRQNNIGYMIACGTLLGAVRHGGFIPWDDDIDIMIRRKDYAVLKKAVQKSNSGLRFIGMDDKENTVYPFAKICAADTMLEESNFRPVDGLGAFVDVFMMDWVPANEQKRARFHARLLRLRKLAQHSSRVSYSRSGSRKTDLLRFAAFWVTRLFDSGRLNRRLNRLCQSWRGDKQWLGIAWSRRECYPLNLVEPFRPIAFEGHEFMGPSDPDGVLRLSFGDYMQLPPEEKRISEHFFQCWCREVEDE